MNRINFHYIKGAHHRTVHCDGVFGGITPRGYVSMTCFSERAPVPKTIVHELKEDGTLGEELDRNTKDGVVRSVEVELLFDQALAERIVEWLQLILKEHKERIAATTD